MIGYKGFDQNFCCHGFQYEIGKTYRCDSEIKICESGFHFCDTPLAVFEFYPPTSRFALVEATGQILDDSGHKFCTNEIHIIKELSLGELINSVSKQNTNTGDCSAATNTGNHSVATNTGDCSAATNTGDHSAATNTGDCSAATNTGYHSAATNTGDHSAAINTGYHSAATVTGQNSIAFATGYMSKAKGTINCWLVLCEYQNAKLVDVRAFKVDGKVILPDVFYTLKEGKPVPADD